MAVVLPFAPRVQSVNSRPSPPEEQSTGHQILLVDEDEGFVDSFGALLKLTGYRVTAEVTYPAALDRVTAHTPDVLITAIHLGDADGWDLVRRARRYQPFLPAIVVTAWPEHVQPGNIGNSVPGVAIFVRPFEPEALLRYLESLCGA